MQGENGVRLASMAWAWRWSCSTECAISGTARGYSLMARLLTIDDICPLRASMRGEMCAVSQTGKIRRQMTGVQMPPTSKIKFFREVDIVLHFRGLSGIPFGKSEQW
jgi:hypothetical protein